MTNRYSPKSRSVAFRALAFGAGILAFGCGSDGKGGGTSSEPAASVTPGVLTGTVDASDAWVGVVTSSDHARFYFCGGPLTYEQVTVWIPTLVEGAGKLRQAKADPRGFVLDARIDGDTITGTLGGPFGDLLDGKVAELTFHATRVRGGSIAGVYETTDPCGHVGLIVNDESPPAGQGACLPDGDTPSVKQ